MGNKVLIIGSGSTAEALAKKLSNNAQIEKIYVAPSNGNISALYENIDYREDDIEGLLKFAIDNGIDLTIPTSEISIKADIVGFFHNNGQNIFGPSVEASNFVINKAIGRKLLYKIHAQTSKFGIFDKLQLAEDWLNTANFPITIRTCESSVADRLTCSTMSIARDFLSDLFSKNINSVLLEEYTFGDSFTVYYVTDGYSAIPITSVRNYKFEKDGDAGILTNGVGCFAPDYKISETVINRVNNIVHNVLTSLDKKGTPYLGVLGVDCTLTNESQFFVNEFKSFFQDFDSSVILSLFEDNFYDIALACIQGLFADEYEAINTNNLFAISTVVFSKNLEETKNSLEVFDGVSNIDIIDSSKFIYTRSASTLARARQYLYEDLSTVSKINCSYRSDIAKTLCEFASF